MDEKHQKMVTFAISIGAFFLTVFGALQAYWTYEQRSNLQVQRAFNDIQLKVCRDLTNLGAKMYSATSYDELYETHIRFAEIKHGEGLMLLDPAVLDIAKDVYNDSLKALLIDEESVENFREAVRCKLTNRPFKLAVACRSMVASALRNEAANDLKMLAPNYAMDWSVACK